MTVSFRPPGASDYSARHHTAASPRCYFCYCSLADGFGYGVGNQSEFAERYYWSMSNPSVKIDLEMGPRETLGYSLSLA